MEEGMVAVVRGLRDAGLAVTLLDSGKQYTLVPNSVLNGPRTTRRTSPVSTGMHRSAGTDMLTDKIDSGLCCDSAAQVTDGRYASVYRTNYCKIRPTSPPVELTEFPPQRSDICRGHDNFVVGGTGSGDNHYCPIRVAESFRGGMVWADRGSVCSPRQSRQHDPFADSLRKYPSLSPERSTEIVERLINYSQTSKTQSRQSTNTSPAVRCPLEAHCSDHQPMPNMKPPNVLSSKPLRGLEPEIRLRRFEESPTRGPKEELKKGIFGRTYDVKCLKETRKMKDNVRGAYLYHNSACPSIRERYETPEQNTPSNVHAEMQAAAQMVCREVSTNPRVEHQRGNVAASPSQAASDAETPSEGVVLNLKQKPSNQSITLVKSVQTKSEIHMKKSVQTAMSSVELKNSDLNIHHNVRKIRSADFNREGIKDEIVDMIEDIFENTLQKNEVLDNICEKLKRYKHDRKVGKPSVDFKTNCKKTSFDTDNIYNISKNCRKNIDKVLSKIGTRRSIIKAYRAEVPTFKISNDFKGILRDWLNDLPMRNRDVLNRVVDKEQIYSTFLKRLRRVADKKKLKIEIVDILDQIPLEMHSCHNKRVYLNRLATSLTDKLQHVNINGEGTSSSPVSRESSPKSRPSVTHIGSHIQPTVDEMKDFVKAEMRGFVENFDTHIDKKQEEEIESELTDLLMESVEAIRSDNEAQVTDEIVSIFRDTAGVFEQQAVYLTNLLIERLKKMFRIIEESQMMHRHSRINTYMVLNTPQATLTDGYNLKADNNADLYTQQIAEQIDQWLNDLGIYIPKSRDNHFRRVVITDLACEIVDRQKYLELNHGGRGTDQDELDHLKYQIFKWINKLVGEDRLETIEHAQDLMFRLKSLPSPFMTKIMNSSSNSVDWSNNLFNLSEPSWLDPHSTRDNLSYDGRQSPRYKFSPNGSPERIYSPQNSFFQDGQCRIGSYGRRIGNETMVYAQSMNSRSGTYPGSNATGSTMNQNVAQDISPSQYLKGINEEYDQFVQNWAQQIPLAVSPEEELLIPRMRMGIVNGVYKALAKLKCQPRLMLNILAYEDAMESELDDLFSQMPPSSELELKKHELKVGLIKKTVHTNDAVRRFLYPETFKEVIVDKYAEYVPRINVDVTESPAEMFEDIQVLALADDFILFTRYKEEDPVKAQVYRKKLLDRTREFVEELKKIHGTELMNIDKEEYVNQIFTGLAMVPVPTESTLKDQADEVLLGMEVEQWYNDLPLNPNESVYEQLKRRRLRDLFAKKIHELGKSINVSDPSADGELRKEISMFLDKMPLAKDESLNINFMVDELANRIRNRVRERDAENSRRRSVGFNETVNYGSFMQNVAHASSIIGPTAATNTSINQSINGEYNLVGPLPPCCMPFSQPCCKSRQNMSVAPYPGNVGAEPTGYESFASQKPLSSSYQADQFPASFDQPQVGSVNVTQPNETTFLTLLDTREEEERQQMLRKGIQPPPRKAAAPIHYSQQSSYMSPEQPYIPITSVTPTQFNNMSRPQSVMQSPMPRIPNPAMMGKTMPANFGMQSIAPQPQQGYVSMPAGYMVPSTSPQYVSYMPQSSMPQAGYMPQTPIPQQAYPQQQMFSPIPMPSMNYSQDANRPPMQGGYHSMMNPYSNSIVQEPSGYGTFEHFPRFDSSKYERTLPNDVKEGSVNVSPPDKSSTFYTSLDTREQKEREAMALAKEPGYFEPSPIAAAIVTPREEGGQTQWYVMKNASEGNQPMSNQCVVPGQTSIRPSDLSTSGSRRPDVDQARSTCGSPGIQPMNVTGTESSPQGHQSVQKSHHSVSDRPGTPSKRDSKRPSLGRPSTPKAQAQQCSRPTTPTVRPPTPTHGQTGQYLSTGSAQKPSISGQTGQTGPSCASSTCPMTQKSEGSQVPDGRPRHYPCGSNYGQPMGYSTPQQGIPHRIPGAPKKMMREGQMEEETDEETDSGRCRCLQRMRRYKKRRVCHPCEMVDVDYHSPGCARYYYPCF